MHEVSQTAWYMMVRDAAMGDRKLVTAIVAEARAALPHGEAWLMSAFVLPQLVATVADATTGALPRAKWKAALRSRLELVPADAGEAAGVSSMAELIDHLNHSIPEGAHAKRVLAALDDLLPTDESGSVLHVHAAEEASALVQLLRGATSASSVALQQRIVRELDGLARPPLGLAGLVQLPYLRAHGLAAPDHASAELASAPVAEGAALSAPSSARRELALFLSAASLARRGDQRGAKHGCILVEGDSAAGGVGVGSVVSLEVLGEGWNMEVFEQRGRSQRKRVLHAEAHAIADAIRRRGERDAFDALQRCTAYIVELRDEAAYDDAPPCRKCNTLLQAVGVPRAVHSTSSGGLQELILPRAKPELLTEPMACQPLSYACDALGVTCERLEHALIAGRRVSDADGALNCVVSERGES